MRRGHATLPVVTLGLLLAVATAAAAGAGGLEATTLDHVEAAREDGLQAADFHHLLFALAWRQSLPDWAVLQAALDRLAAAPGDPLVHDQVRLYRARIAVDEGRSAAAREIFRTMGGLDRWWVHGPASVGELEDFVDLALPPDEQAEWRPAPGTDPLGWVRLSGLAWPARRQLLYLATTIASDRLQPVAVRLGASQVARAWLNGTAVLTTDHPLGHAEDQAAGGGWLGPGSNLLVVAVASESSDWWLRVRLTAPDGARLEGTREMEVAPAPCPAVERATPPVRTLAGDLEGLVAAGDEQALLALAALHVESDLRPSTTGAARTACREARRADPALARFLEWLVTSEPEASRDLLEGAVSEDPDFLFARVALARWYHERGLYERAKELLERVASEPSARAVWLGLDTAQWGAVMLPELARTSREAPRCAEAAAILAERAVEAERWDLAREGLARLQEVVPGWQRTLDLRQQLASSCGDGEALRGVLRELLEADPNQPEMRVRLSRLESAAGDLGAARGVLDEGLRRCPDHPELLLELARQAHAAGRDVEARQLTRRLLDSRPQERRAQHLLELLGGEAEDLSWRRSGEELLAMAGSAPRAMPAVVVLDHREVRFLPGSLTEERVQRAVLVTKADQADELLRTTIAWVPERQRLRVLSARVLRRDGSEVSATQADTPRLRDPGLNLYYDTRLRVLQFQDLEDEDMLEFSYLLSEVAEANETGPYEGGLLPIGGSEPVHRAEVELVGPEELLPSWQLVHLAGEPRRLVDAEGRIHLAWAWDGLPAIPNDLPPGPELLTTPHLVYSNHPGWGDLAEWYRRHVAPRVRASRQVEDTARGLSEGIADRRRKIARIYRFVSDEIRYVGLELGEHRFRPFPADWVLNHRMGDCKDKAALLVALLGAVDVPAQMVLLRTAEQGPIAAELALLEYFDHAIVYLPDDDLWLDGTATGHDPFLPPAPDQGAVALVIAGPDSAPRTTPLPGAGESRLECRLRPGDSGQVDVVLRTVETGEAATARRAAFAFSKDPSRYSRWLQRQLPGAELVEEPISELPPGRDPAVVELHATVPRAALLSGGGLPAYPGQLEPIWRLVPAASRRGPLVVVARPDLVWTVEVELGRPPVDLPENVDLDTPSGVLRLRFSKLASGYRVEGELRLRPGLIPADRAAELRDFLLAAERHMTRPLEVP